MDVKDFKKYEFSFIGLYPLANNLRISAPRTD